MAATTSHPQTEFTSSTVGYIPSLDGIRALSLVIVFAAHAGLDRWVPGMWGLAVFFFLSGFLITTLLRAEWERTGTIDLRQFYGRRAVRILPPFYVVFVGASVLTLLGVLPGSLHPAAVLMQFLHLGNYEIVRSGWWDGRAPGTWVLWSLAVEEHFYLVFPLLYVALRRHALPGRHQALVFGTLCVLVLVWRCLLVWGLGAAHDRVYVATDTRIDGILWGCVLAVFGNPVLDRRRTSDQALLWGWLPLGVALIGISFAVRAPWWDQTVRYTLQGIGLLPLFTVAIRFHDRGIVRLLNARWLKRTGVLSYGLYLVHAVVIEGVQHWLAWHPLAQGVAAWTLSYALASLLHRCVEQPCARLRKRWDQQKMTRSAPQPPVDLAMEPISGEGAVPVPAHA